MAKYKSRAARFNEVVSEVEMAAEVLLDATNDAKESENGLLDVYGPEEITNLNKAIAAFKDTVSSSRAEVESLRDEIESWKDNMESASMEHLPKYDQVSECYDALEETLGAFDDAEGIEEVKEADDIDRLKEEVEGLDFRINEPMFPGMFS